jgi:ankyrin repeat protein
MGQSALICACGRGHTAIARTLLEAGADVHVKDEVSFLQLA